MSSALESLLARVTDPDPFGENVETLRPLQLRALTERLNERRAQIRVLDQRAREAGVDAIESLDDLVPLLFAHTTYKSYPESWVEQGRWDRLNRWLDTLSTQRVKDVDVAAVRDVDDWLARLHRAGHYVFSTSGTTGKCSFLCQTASDRAMTRTNQIQSFRWATGIEPRADRAVFIIGPHLAPTRYGDVFLAMAEAYGRPDAVYFLSEEPLRAADLNRMGAMRRAIAECRATPTEIAAFDAEARSRQERMHACLTRMVEALLRHRGEPIILFGPWAQVYALVAAARERGIPDGDFHPDTAMISGGGLKGVKLPPDYQEQVLRFFNLDPSRIEHPYGMQECSSHLPRCRAGRYHVPPWVVLLVLERSGERRAPLDGDEVEGRMAFFDLALDGRWGGLVSGDRIRSSLSPCPCGRRGPTVFEDIVRYTDLPEGDDKLTCGGTIESYVKGVIDL